jgi:hypothetical protein
VRRTEFRPQCPELLSPTRGTQAGWFPPSSAVVSSTVLLTSVGVTVRHGKAPGFVLGRLALQRGGWLYLRPLGDAKDQRVGVVARGRLALQRGASPCFFSLVRFVVMSGHAQHAWGRARKPCRATRWGTIWSATAPPGVGLAARKACGAPPNNAMQLTRGGWSRVATSSSATGSSCARVRSCAPRS